MDSDKEKILKKIKKCLALAKSSNANEAAIALRQAQKLMAEHGISADQVKLSDVQIAQASTARVKTPPQWHTSLIGMIQSAFSVKCIYMYGYSSHVEFIGIGSAAEIASYAYTVLHRQVKKDRAEYLNKLSNNCKRSTKIRRADAFAEGWVSAVYRKITVFAAPAEHAELIKQYMDVSTAKYGALKDIDERSHKYTSKDEDAKWHGYKAGKSAQLHNAMDGSGQARLGTDNER